jgi:N-acetyl-gamma-glutamyl-phosphate reductase
MLFICRHSRATPLVKGRLADPLKVVIDGLSGTAGAGADLSRPIHHPEIGSNVVLYNVVGHRHTFEIEQELTRLGGIEVRVHFTPCYIPIVQGIVSVCRCFPTERLKRNEALDDYREFYAGQPFIKIFDRPRGGNQPWNFKPYPAVSAVAGTNVVLDPFCPD